MNHIHLIFIFITIPALYNAVGITEAPSYYPSSPFHKIIEPLRKMNPEDPKFKFLAEHLPALKNIGNGVPKWGTATPDKLFTMLQPTDCNYLYLLENTNEDLMANHPERPKHC